VPEKPFDEELTPDSLLRAYAMGIFPMSDGEVKPITAPRQTIQLPKTRRTTIGHRPHADGYNVFACDMAMIFCATASGGTWPAAESDTHNKSA